MKRKKPSSKSTRTQRKPALYTMRLYVTGATPRSSRAIANLRKLCDQHLSGRYKLEIIDVYQQPELAREGQIIAAPTLVKAFPLPLRRFIGDMSNTENLLAGLEVRVAPTSGASPKPDRK